MSYEPCPDFELAPFTRNRRDLFLNPPDPADGFILAMSLAFNDLKSAMWLLEQLNRGTPDETDVPTPYLGQIQGMKVHVTRTLFALLHELLFAIETAAEGGAFESPAFRQALRLLSPASMSAWGGLFDAATHANSANPLRKFLAQIRNNVASHYYDPKQLLRGYRYHFEVLEPSLFNESALSSIGPRLEHTRFYFADAAAAGYQRVLDPDSELLAASNTIVRQVNQALRGLIETYLKVKESMTN